MNNDDCLIVKALEGWVFMSHRSIELKTIVNTEYITE